MHMATADTTTATPRNSTPRFSQTLFLGRLVQSPNRSQAGFEAPSRFAQCHADAPSILQTNETVRIGSANSGAGGGIRTHEGLRHRVLSPRQASARAFCPLDLALVPPQTSEPRIRQRPWANKDYLAAHVATIYSQDPAAMGQAFGETRREAGQKIRNPTLFSLNSDKRRTSPDQ